MRTTLFSMPRLAFEPASADASEEQTGVGSFSLPNGMSQEFVRFVKAACGEYSKPNRPILLRP
jgi:hypothetical protein